MNARFFFCILLCYLILGGVTNALAQQFQPKYLREQDKTLLSLTANATPDGWLDFSQTGEAVEAASFSTRFTSSLGLQDGYQLRVVRDRTDVKENRHQHCQLYYKNVLVEGGHLDLHSRKGRLVAAHARIIDNLAIAVDKPIEESRALETALANRKLTRETLKDQELPKGELVLTSVDGNYLKESYRLAYYFDLYGQNLAEANRVYIDARTGNVLKQHLLIDNCFGHPHKDSNEHLSPVNKSVAELSGIRSRLLLAATFNSRYPRSNPTPTFEVEDHGGGNTRLTMSTPNVNSALDTRWDANNNLAWDDALLTNAGLNWGTNFQDATITHWTTWRSYQYFLNRFGMQGTDGLQGIARVLIAPSLPNNAEWSPQERLMVIGSHNGNVISSLISLVMNMGMVYLNI